MKFGRVPVRDAEGGISVHSIRKASLVLKKGTAIGKAEIAVAIIGEITARLRLPAEKAS